MRSLWNGSISFGLVNVPVKMFAATEEKDVRFRTLHKKCNTPIKYQKVCPTCDEEVGPDDVVKAFEYEKGRYVVISAEELEALAVAQTRTIDIVDFVNLKDIDPIYWYKTYYLGPSDTGHKAYALLRMAMEQTGKVAIAKIVLRDKQHLAAVRVLPDCLALAMMYYPDEIRVTSALPDLTKVEVHDNEIRMATQLIESLTAEFEAAKYTDDYRESLLKLIEAKISGDAVAMPTPERPSKVVDLMDALKASLDMVEKSKSERQARPTGD